MRFWHFTISPQLPFTSPSRVGRTLLLEASFSQRLALNSHSGNVATTLSLVLRGKISRYFAIHREPRASHYSHLHPDANQAYLHPRSKHQYNQDHSSATLIRRKVHVPHCINSPIYTLSLLPLALRPRTDATAPNPQSPHHTVLYRHSPSIKLLLHYDALLNGRHEPTTRDGACLRRPKDHHFTISF